MLAVGAGLLGLAAGEARADWTKPSDHTKRQRQPFCLFFAGPACTNTLYLDGVGAYQRAFDELPGDKDFGRIGGEIGYALRLGNSLVQLGPAFEAGGLLNDTTMGWQIVPKIRMRFWPGHYGIGLEAAGGYVYTAQQSRELDDEVRRMGAHGEIGVSFWGAVTIVGGGDWLRDAQGVSSANVMVGARITAPFVPWVLLAIARSRGGD